MKKFKTIMIVAISTFLSTVACVNYEQTGFVLKGEVRDDTISDIAYDKNKNFGYTVYIKENGEYEPYLVLTKNYNEDSGNVLLLRKDLLNEQEAYNQYESYYPDTLIDKHLSEKFLPTLDDKLRDIIVNSEIEVAAPDLEKSLYDTRTYNTTEKIHRQVFLLSFIEVGFFVSEAVGFVDKEGKPLKYFKMSKLLFKEYKYYRDKKQMAYRNGEQEGYLLRTPYRGSESGGGWFVNPYGEGYMTNPSHEYYGCGIRPAFCLPPDTPIKKEVIDGKEVYVLVY